MSLLGKIYNALGSFNGGDESDKQIDAIIKGIECNSKEVVDTVKSIEEDIRHYNEDIVYGGGPPYSWSAHEAGYMMNKLNEVINKIVANCDACSLNFTTVDHIITATHHRYAFTDRTLFRQKIDNIVEKIDCNSPEINVALKKINEHKSNHEFNTNFNSRIGTRWTCEKCATNSTDSFEYILSNILNKCDNNNRLIIN